MLVSESRFRLASAVPDREKSKSLVCQSFGVSVQSGARKIGRPFLPGRQFLPGDLPAVNRAEASFR
jgi:hypothetical protein